VIFENKNQTNVDQKKYQNHSSSGGYNQIPIDPMIPDIPGQPVGNEYAREVKQKVSSLLGTRSDKFPGAQPGK
jgi:hypothetical protein